MDPLFLIEAELLDALLARRREIAMPFSSDGRGMGFA
jgi:hypothetical protein